MGYNKQRVRPAVPIRVRSPIICIFERITCMSLTRHLTKLLPLAVVLAVGSIVALAARSPLPSAPRSPEVGTDVSDLKPVVDLVNAEFNALWNAAGVAPAGPALEL